MENQYIYIGIPTINGEIDGEPILLKTGEVFEYYDNNECVIIKINIVKNTVDFIKYFFI